jgi:hypothetical protein
VFPYGNWSSNLAVWTCSMYLTNFFSVGHCTSFLNERLCRAVKPFDRLWHAGDAAQLPCVGLIFFLQECQNSVWKYMLFTIHWTQNGCKQSISYAAVSME